MYERSQAQVLNEGMACCHAITYVNDELVGDPLEIKMFEMTKWKLEEDVSGSNMSPSSTDIALANVRSSDSNVLSIIRRFDFESKLQRMSVVIKRSQDNSYYSYVKGSPEMIKSLSVADSLPVDFDRIMNKYTMQGYRLIAFGYKKLEDTNYLKIQKSEREEAESDIVFLGFMITENKLKEATTGTISDLNECDIRTIMATGDNILTAISVAKKCNILQENQVVYYGSIEEGELIWRKAENMNDSMNEPDSKINMSAMDQSIEV